MVAFYARQSVDKKDSISIENQIDFCKHEIMQSDTYKEYIDKGFSGKDTNRPAFEKMIKDIKSGLINKVVVYKLDRISRSTLDFANIIDVFNKHNVDFISSTEKFDTSTPIGKAMLQIIMVFAELERETIQKRIKDNYYARGKKGFYMGGRAPYGFNKIDTKVDGLKTYTFDENQKQVNHLVEMFDLYVNTDRSLGQVSAHLNSIGVAAPEGGNWDSCKISRILRNPVYVKADADIYLYYKNKGCSFSNDLAEFVGINGCYLYGKRSSNERKYTNVENHVVSLGLHKGVIDSDTFLSAQYKLDNNKSVKNSGNGKRSWLTGIAKCGYCGYAVCASAYKHFNCRGKTNYKICKGHSVQIRVDEVENSIKNGIIEKAIELRGEEFTFVEKENQSSNNIKLQIIEIDNQIENLVNQIANANDTVMKYFNERISKLDLEKSTLLEEVKKATLRTKSDISLESVLDKISSWDELDFDEKKNICSFLIEKVRIKDDEILIDWLL